MRPAPRLLPACAISLLVLLLAGCSSNSQPFNDTPAITNLFPSSAAAGGPAFTLNVTGTGFIAQSLVYWNNTQLTTTFNSDTLQLSASVPASDIAGAGVAQVVVVSPAPGGGMSNASTFTINPAPNPVPTIASLTPSSAAVGVLPPSGALLVNGTNFISSSVVAFNGVSRSTNFVSATQLSVPLSSADVAANATISVTASNPAPGGGVSNAASFVVGTGHAVRLKSAALAAGVSFPQLISANSSGGASNGRSSAPAISADARFVAFYSTATNLIAAGPSGNIFVRDACLGAANCTPQTVAADLAADGSAPNGPAVAGVAISADGRFVSFASAATNLLADAVSAPPGTTQVYLRDLCAGPHAPANCVPRTVLVSSANGAPSSVPSALPSMSADGRFVAFVSAATNLSNGFDARGLFVRDTCAGPAAPSLCAPKTYTVPLQAASPSSVVIAPAISADGRYVAFVLGDSSSPQVSRVLQADMCLGPDAPSPCQPSLINISVGADGSELDAANSAPSISADGRFVAFLSQMPGGAPRVFLRDNCLGASATPSCVPATSLLAQNAATPSIQSSARYVSYVAFSASNASSPAGAGALYVYDTCFGASAACIPQAHAVNGDPAVSSAAPFLADRTNSAPIDADASFIVFSTSAAIPALPMSGLGDVLLSVTPF